MPIMTVAILLSHMVHAVTVSPDELDMARRWTSKAFDEGGEPPFSFLYGGRSSSEFLPTCKLERAQGQLGANRTERILTYTDTRTGLSIRCVVVEYRDFPTVEWTLHFKNNGTQDTPILSDIRAMDVPFERASEGEFLLHHNRGDLCAVNSFEPLVTRLEPKMQKRFVPAGGRPTNGEWPYYNIEWSGGGVITVIGWPGQWAATFTRDDRAGLRLRAGQELTHFTLRPGEEVRSPLGLLQFYQGDWLRAQNVWRRFMFAHNFPKPKEGALGPVLAACSGWQFPKLMCNQAGEIEFINRYLEEGIKLDYWWMDAGWYPCDEVGWPKVGTWEVDAKRYPGGLRAVTDHAHARGLKGLVWFEPERVHAGTWLADNHPEWIFGGKNGGLLNLGNPDACAWLTAHVDKLITEQGIDLYRQDFNIDPLDFWRKNDSEDRQGITEIRHVEGYLAYWDELHRRHPGMLIDSCASGGRRNNLETMRRAVPLLRTDFEFQNTGNQCCTYGFDLWLPYHECGNRDIEPYAFRSNMAVWLGLVWDVRKRDLDYALGRKLVGQWRAVAPYYLGDIYPLTRYSTAEDQWMAWQFDRPDLGEGLVQAFRRPESTYESVRLCLHNLEPDTQYTLTDLDQPASTRVFGRELMKIGLPVSLPVRPAAAVITYKRAE